MRPYKATGIEQFVENVVLQVNHQDDIVLAIPRSTVDSNRSTALTELLRKSVRVIHIPLLPTPIRVIFEMIVLGFLFFRCKSVFSVNNFGPLFGKPGQKRLIMIHDVWHLSRHYDGNVYHRLYYSFLIRLQIRRSERILTVSEFSRNEISRLLNVKMDRISVIGNCVNQALNYRSVTKSEAIYPAEYFLLIGSDRKNKNIARTLVAYQEYADQMRFPVPIVVVGPYSQEFKDSLNLNRISQNLVSWQGYVSRREMDTLLDGCIAVVFPSLYEGFGIPVIEAISAEKPLLISNGTAMSDFAHPVSILVDGESVRSISTGLRKLVSLSRSDLKAEFRKLSRKLSDCSNVASLLEAELYS